MKPPFKYGLITVGVGGWRDRESITCSCMRCQKIYIACKVSGIYPVVCIPAHPHERKASKDRSAVLYVAQKLTLLLPGDEAVRLIVVGSDVAECTALTNTSIITLSFLFHVVKTLFIRLYDT